MSQHLTTEIAILGAGVIGLACAERLSAEGHEVVLVDPGPPGGGCSHGNAGTIADYAVAPVGTPAVLAALPSLLFDRNSPLALRRAALPALMPWLLRFARQSLPAAAARNAQAIAALLAGAGPMWRDLAGRTGTAGLLRADGCLYLYRSAPQVRAATEEMAGRRALGVQVEMLDSAALAGLEPGLPPMAGAAFFPGALFLTDPGAMMRGLAAHLAPLVPHLPARATRLTRLVDGVRVDGLHADGSGLHLHARRVVIAAGAQSRALALQAGDRVPLDTERGYHVEWDRPAPNLAPNLAPQLPPPLTRPACLTDRGFYLCPMAGRLRAAGTVELGGLRLPPSPHRVAKLTEGARLVFPDLGPPDRDWMGFRPSMPDSLPVVGASQGGDDIVLAFGHGHLGVTLAPVTAGLVADAIARRPPGRDTTALRPGRF